MNNRQANLAVALATVILYLLPAGGQPAGAAEQAPAANDAGQNAQVRLAEVIAGSHRSAQDKARDQFRHPEQTLEFFGLKPDMTVVEIWPASGWYTDIIAPYLATGGGKFYAGQIDPKGASPGAQEMLRKYKDKVSDTALYGDVTITAFNPKGDPVAPDGSADMVVSFRNLHNWIMGGWQDEAIKTIYAALKPGGIFGIVDHRASDSKPQDPKASSGYVREDYAIQLIEKAGFELIESSPINNNPEDTKDHPFGVWTLPPTLRTEPRGEPKNSSFDSTPYIAIGESDRFTLKFRKPETAD